MNKKSSDVFLRALWLMQHTRQTAINWDGLTLPLQELSLLNMTGSSLQQFMFQGVGYVVSSTALMSGLWSNLGWLLGLMWWIWVFFPTTLSLMTRINHWSNMFFLWILAFEQSKITSQTIKDYFLSNVALRTITYCFPVQFINCGPLQLDWAPQFHCNTVIGLATTSTSSYDMHHPWSHGHLHLLL